MNTQTLILLIVGVVLAIAAMVAIVAFIRRRANRSNLTHGRHVARETPTSDSGTPVAVPEEDGASGSVAELRAPVQEVELEPAAAGVDDAAEIDRPEAVAGRMTRLRARLAGAGTPFGQKLLALLSKDHLDESDWDELEEVLLLADVGAAPTSDLIDALRTRTRVLGVRDTETVRSMLHEELVRIVDGEMDRTLATAAHPADGDDVARPAVVLMVGVNGTGKTTTVGKLARVLVADDSTVLLGAADTFRAAAAEQLATWGARVGVDTIRSERDGADPASVAFDAVRTGIERGIDVVLVDTAGRLQNKAGLMEELGKIKRVIEKVATVDEVLLVLDATTGQNGLNQARVFSDVVNVTGIVLTKLDGTAKGGIVIAVQRELGVPVKLIGLGEGPDDLAPFTPDSFVSALLD